MTATLIKKLLSEAAFNPKTPGPLAAILGDKNASYLPERAIELIRESQIGIRTSDKIKSLKLAIQLLVMTESILISKELPSKKVECNLVFSGADQITYHCTKNAGHKGNHEYKDITTRKVVKEIKLVTLKENPDAKV